jgi:TAT-translocated FGD2 family F420-dependent dehydrogenase
MQVALCVCANNTEAIETMSEPYATSPVAGLSRRALLAGAGAAGALLSLSATLTRRALAVPIAQPSPQPISSRTHQLAFVLSHEQFATPDLLEFGITAEHAGFDGMWTSDHIQPWQENQGHSMFPWITLALLGAQTRTSFFGTGVTTPTYRYNPSVVAQAFASLAVLYPGRVFLGVGTGEALNELATTGQFGRYQERHDRLAEAVALIRQLWSGEHVTFSGQYYAVQNARIYDLPSQPVPIYVAGNGPKSARLAGEIGDGWITTPQTLANAELHDAFREGALSVGKNPDQMPIVVEDFVVVGGESEANEAATFWRFAPIGFKELLYLPDPRAIEQRAMAELPTPWNTWRDWTVSTDPAAHIKHVQGLWAAGATHVFVHSGNQDQMRMIDFYGREVIPRLSRA